MKLKFKQTNIISNTNEPGYSMRKFKKKPDDVKYVRELLEQAGL